MAEGCRSLGLVLLLLQMYLASSNPRMAGSKPMSLGELLAESSTDKAKEFPQASPQATIKPIHCVSGSRQTSTPPPGRPGGMGSVNAEQLCLRGQEMLARGDQHAALAAYERAVDLRPDHGPALMMLGRLVDHVKGNSTEASGLYVRALGASPDSAAILSNYAFVLENKYSDRMGAENLYRRALHADPTSIATYNNLAHLIEERDTQNDRAVPEAECLYKRALEINPTSALTLSNYAGMLHDRLADGVGAGRLYAKALEMEPTNIEVMLNYALVVEEWSEDQTLSKTLYKKALAIDPAHGLAMLRYGRRLRLDKNFKESAKVFAAAKKLYPNSEMVHREAWMLQDDEQRVKEEEKARIMEAGGQFHPKIERDEAFDEDEHVFQQDSDLESME